MSLLDRRSFLQHAAALSGGVWMSPWLQGLLACRDSGTLGQREAGIGEGGYGPLAPSADCPELTLPEGFRGVTLSRSGQAMSDGAPTPNGFDGMAAFPLPNGNIRLIRNHEMRDAAASARPFGNAARAYDAKGPGGTTSLEVLVRPDGTPEVVRAFPSLNGTHINCAGGPTPWGSWLSCEETTEGAAQGRSASHGYVFEVPVSAESEVTPVPYRAMGRFVHEAVAVDATTGLVYLTEDRDSAGFYRFTPAEPGNLRAGGRLQALAVRDRPGYRTRTGQQPGMVLPVGWVDVDNPDPSEAETDPGAVFQAAVAKGAAVFARLEGCWYAENSVFFHATEGGDSGLGQVWHYRPRGDSGEELALMFESRSADLLRGPDNITVSPRGGLLICEDGRGNDFLRGLTPGGAIFSFAQNIWNSNEFAGACFSPDGRILFVNIQGSTTSSGMVNSLTVAIWGPWEKGAL
ncbi:MAG: DUF839 domain-containing protein [Gemmatimonadetes bacterium]|nr:DUF839 domain-containing protein [Gemmatimonadota bacterium]